MAIQQQPQYLDSILELVGGEIIEMSKPGGLRGYVTMQIGSALNAFVNQHKLDYVTAAETGYITQRNSERGDTVRGLDCGFISNDRLPDGIPDKHIQIVPDLAVEVISPGNTAEDIDNKVRELLNAGTHLIWIVYTKSKSVYVYTQDDFTVLESSDKLDGQNVLPGFELPIDDIFPEQT